ncbi:hypothetical protein N480_18450 [Pseudoalteromonas luteoviolacea S2607]|nr:hypothetical protein N480_18450 [Pseudoalteromonas luteoviolacea S2607]
MLVFEGAARDYCLIKVKADSTLYGNTQMCRAYFGPQLIESV